MNTQTNRFVAPDLGDDQIIGAICGLRPCRHGGLRIEIESIGSKTIVHNYGHGGCGVTISFGTADLAADLVEQVASRGESIAVLGAGVVGLTTALDLLQRGYQVTLYAPKVAHDTTSVIAGALWLPVGVEFGTTQESIARKSKILRTSIDRFRSIDRVKFGVEQLPIYEPASSHTEEGLFDDGLILPPTVIEEFPFVCSAIPGRVFQTEFIHTRRFLGALVVEIAELGGRFELRKFDHRDELDSLNESVIVNCTAMGSKSLFEDPNIYAARGVLVHLQPQNLGYCVHDGYKYMFPREDALILGGCFQEDRWDDAPDQAMIDEILTHHRRFFGQL